MTDMEVKETDSCIMCEKEAKYTCPKCDGRTCSLDCVRAHKKEKDCSGIAPRTVYLDIEQMSDQSIRADFHFLEDGSRFVDLSSRDPKINLGESKKQLHNKLGKRFKMLRKGCLERKIQIQFMSPEMTRHKENDSSFLGKTNMIIWRMEWCFVNSNETFHESKISENQTWIDVLTNHFQKNQKLTEYKSIDTESLGIFIQAFDCPANAPRYFQFSPSETIIKSLENMKFYEYPKIYVVFGEEMKKYADAIATLQDNVAPSLSSGFTDNLPPGLDLPNKRQKLC